MHIYRQRLNGIADDVKIVELKRDEINVPIALSNFRDGDQGPSKVTKTMYC